MAAIDPLHETSVAENVAARSLHRASGLIAADDAVIVYQRVKAFELVGEEVLS